MEGQVYDRGGDGNNDIAIKSLAYHNQISLDFSESH